MTRPLLSIIIPVAPNRRERLQAVLSRLSLNMAVFPQHTFEVLVADGGATDGTRDICETMQRYMRLKYVFLPIYKFINAGYPRNVLLRMCEGQIIAMIDIDHWPGENVIFGMLHPFVHDMNFPIMLGKETKTIGECANYLNGGCLEPTFPASEPILNRGYVIDSSKSQYCSINGIEYADELNKVFLNPNSWDKKMLDIYTFTRIPPPGINNTLWIWAIRRQDVVDLNGYDELYCRQFAYCREDDDWRERLLAKGLKFYDGQNKNFCAIHMWHPAAQRNQQPNELNKRRFNETCHPVKQVRRNEGFQWGAFLADSFAIMNGEIMTTTQVEAWIKENVPDMPNYHGYWNSLDAYMAELETYAKQQGAA